jgi:type VI secretion system secreted protein Hcp
MAVDMFLKIDGIKGESQDDKHKGEIQLSSFEWGATNKATGGYGGGSGAGKVSVRDLVIKKYADASSPHLSLHCCTGTHMPSALLTIRKAGDKPLEYLKLKLMDVFISGFEFDSKGELVTESVNLNFSKFHIDYVVQKADGSADGAPIAAGFDIKANKKV